MTKKKEEITWITAKQAAEILTRNSGRPITQAYVRRLGNGSSDMAPQFTTWQVDDRTRLYNKEDVEKYTVKKRGDGSVRPSYMRLPKHVKLINSTSIRFECEICGQIWAPNLLPGGRLPRNSKMCPNGCTAAQAPREKKAAGA